MVISSFFLDWTERLKARAVAPQQLTYSRLKDQITVLIQGWKVAIDFLTAREIV